MIKINSSSKDIYLKYEEIKGWYIHIQGVNYDLELSNHRVLLSLLPFLELKKDDIVSRIKDNSAISSFPELIIIEAGLKNGSEHWSSSAFNWIEDNSFSDLNFLEPYFKDIYNNRKYSQAIRHRAKSFLTISQSAVGVQKPSPDS